METCGLPSVAAAETKQPAGQCRLLRETFDDTSLSYFSLLSVCMCVCHTLCLHTGADQGQRVAGELTAGAGNGAAGQQDQHARVGAVGAVLLQVAVLQRLRRNRNMQQ